MIHPRKLTYLVSYVDVGVEFPQQQFRKAHVSLPASHVQGRVSILKNAKQNIKQYIHNAKETSKVHLICWNCKIIKQAH